VNDSAVSDERDDDRPCFFCESNTHVERDCPYRPQEES
jgi:hypothetical protein